MTLFEQKAKIYVPRLEKELGLNSIHASGIWGNIGAETGGLKHKQEINPTVKGSRGGYGLLQWTGPRRVQLEKYAQARGFDIYDLSEEDYYEVSHQFLVHECKTTEIRSIAALRKTTTIEAATETFMLLNLRPGVPHLESRIRWGKKALAAVQGIKPVDIKPPVKPKEPEVKPTPAPEAGTAGAGIMATIIAAWQASWKWALAIAITTVIAVFIIRMVKRKVEKDGRKKQT